MPISKENIAVSFSKAAVNYENNAFLQQEVADRLLERLELMNSNPAAILDAGCGTGYCTRALKGRFPKAKLFGVDLAEGMIEQAKKTQKLFKHNDYQVGDIENLPFESNAFDLVFSNLAILWMDNPEIVLQELNRVLKPKGLIIFSTMGP
ncbi:MAG: methyltransferase domain-containing protein, partial [Kangiellaceae bacterium]|nr:methyltransferase domain-containing protein [Kangiellaceae bacterium]